MTTETKDFRIPTPQEVVNNASFILCDQPSTSCVSNTILLTQLFPFMNFTCNSTITRLTFIAKRTTTIRIPYSSKTSRQLPQWTNELSTSYVASWPRFSLWRHYNDSFYDMGNGIGPSDSNQLLVLQVTEIDNMDSARLIHRTQIELTEVNLTEAVKFKEGDILGLNTTWQFTLHLCNFT